MAFQTFENDKNNRGQIKRKNLKNEIRSAWLGWRDSNPRMHGPKPCALPLGDTPIYRKIRTMNYSTIGVGLLSPACVSVYNRE